MKNFNIKILSLRPWPKVVGMVLRKILDQYVSYQRWIKSVIRLGNNVDLKNFNKNFSI